MDQQLATPEFPGELLEMVFDRVPVGLAVLDKNLTLCRANPTWVRFIERYTPTSAAKVIPGARFIDLAPGTEDTSLRRYRRALAGETVREEAVPMESGGIVSYWDVILTPLIENGTVVGLVDVTIDVTERKLAKSRHRDHLEEAVAARTVELTRINEELQREIDTRRNAEDEYKRAEEALRAREERHRELVESANSIILRMNVNGEITYFNEFAQRFFGYRADEILGRHVIGTIVPPTDSSGLDLAAMVKDFCLHPESYATHENENMRRNGERVWISWTNKAICDKDGRAVELLCIGLDISDRKQYEEALWQASVKLEWQISETRRRMDELQTMFAVQQAITSRLDPDAVLQLIADEARRLTSSQRTAVFMVDGESLCVSVVSGDDSSGMLGYRMPIGQSLTGQSLQTGEVVRVNDARHDPRVNAEIVARAGVQSFITIPLISGTQPIGAIAVVDKTTGPYGPEDERVLTMLASGAVIGLENARLYHVEQERRREADQRRQVAEGLRDILGILNSNRSLNEILDYIIAGAGRLLGTDACAIFRLKAERGLFSIQAARGLSDEHMAEITIPAGQSAVGRAVAERRPVVVKDLGSQQDLWRDPDMRKHLTWLARKYAGLLAVPLISKDEIYGGIVLYYPEPRDFSPEELELAVSFADQATLAIENARLRAQAEETAVAAERSRLARDLHDAVTQTLFSASLIAEVLPKLWDKDPAEGRRRLGELRQLTRGALAEMRTLLLELRPATLVEVGLDDLLRQLTEATTGRARLPVALEVEGGHRHLPPDVQVALYRIAQEALNNVAKHSGADQATVALRCRPDLVELRVRDNGRGFDPGGVLPDRLGLGIMRERAEAIKAALTIESRPGRGTEIAVTWAG